MTNITPVVSFLLTTEHAAAPIQEHVHSPDRLDTFLQEAYRINSHISSLLVYLRQIRQPYLSTSTAPPPRKHRSTPDDSRAQSPPIHLTDAQRTEIDTQTSTLLHELSSNISSLTAAENLRNSTETALLERRFGSKRGGGGRNNVLWRWAAGGEDNADDGDESAGKGHEQLEAEGRATSIKTFREGVLWYLGWRLQGAVETQRGMVEVRAAREREKEKSVLWKMKTDASAAAGSTVESSGGGMGGGGGQIPRRTATATQNSMNGHLDYKMDDNYNPTLDDSITNRDRTSEEMEMDNLPPNLQQLFESENSTLLAHYNTTLSKIAQAEKSLLEISSLQSTLLTHLSTQGEMIEQLVQDAQGTGEDVRRGNRELKRAGERWGKGLARGVFWVTVGLCGFLVGWDLVF
ncbi:hypothetical protein EPUS_08828 [Endocarpon pusillum Z07020]|uniref:t-SNARE coiled-coil homology domain-containing protein n=1 Tax=Endocarpon pusillum (strain Z07020 / HMAS-L-300199) TaxID=1263415 RepID=U1HGS6_ENDPU|nr:uncharacterized protein EPUS_08828 [Endocarpon pusillum Z07020]ERF69355.1 hypothetical protein EPUS_08828 [Endocarpon pusillum Z07020]